MRGTYDGREVVGMDLHRCRSVLVRMAADGRKLETSQITNSRRQQRRELSHAWLKLGRLSAQARTQRFLRRHPRSFFTVLTVFLCYVTIGTIYRLVQSRATVFTGWPEAVVIGASVTVALVALHVKGFRQRPYGLTHVWSLYGILGAFMLGLAPNEPLAFGGWARIRTPSPRPSRPGRWPCWHRSCSR